jgi:PAS domain S-box-containing protein
MTVKVSLQPIRILLIDDDDDDFFFIRDLIKEIRELKYEVDRVATYEEGLDALKTQSYQVCLLDYRLGAQTGLELLRESKKFDNQCPIILLTGYGDIAVDMQAMQMGAADYLVKDRLTSEPLGRSIRYAIKQAHDLKNLREQTNNFKTLFNSTFEGILVHRDGVVIDANRASGEIFGFTPSEMIGSQLSRYFHPEDHDQLKANYSSVSEKGQELTGVRCDSDEIPIEISSRSVTLKGQLMSITTVQDLSQRKHLEAQVLQQDRLASLGLMASSLAHEIGTPLGVIRGRAEMIELRAPDDIKQNMGLIISQIDRITKLMHAVLQLARGRQTDTVTEVHLVAILNDILQLLNHEFERKQISVDVKIQGDPIVRAEPGPLGQVFLNLLVNAIHAIEDAKIKDRTKNHRITISSRADGEALELSIQDTGAGIAQKNLTDLFRPFFTTKSIGSGTGLGLAISLKILQSWGGSIRVESTEGQGANFLLGFKQ